jgi:hypothetical protein
MKNVAKVDMTRLREALEASWHPETAYLHVSKEGNPALGQCYPTSRVIQHFFPETEIVKGRIWNGRELETHFWNVLTLDSNEYHVDLTWQQFPHGSSVRSYELMDRNSLGDGQQTIRRVELLLDKVKAFLANKSQDGLPGPEKWPQR